MMKNLALIWLIAFLPIQMTWAAVSVYCTHHEDDKAAQHFGHHGDEHEGHHDYEHEDVIAADNDSGQPDSQKTTEQSHGHHHHGGTLGMMTFVWLPTHDASSTETTPGLQALISSLPPSQPERPNWRTAT